MPRYENIHVGKRIYVSSTSHCFVRVRFDECRSGRVVKSYNRAYEIGGLMLEAKDGFIGRFTVPNYMIREVNRQLHETLSAGAVEFYEVDRDGNERRDNLRYFDEQMWEWCLDRVAKLSQYGTAVAEPV